MPHSQISLSPVTPELEADFTKLWTQARVGAGASEDWALRASTGGRVSAAIAREDVRLYLARSGETPVGYIVLVQSPVSVLSESSCVWIDQLYVVPEARRDGVAKLLLQTAAHFAEQIGAAQVASCVPSAERETNGFYARLGFTSYLVRRVIPTAHLRRRLAGADVDAAVQVVQRRRSLRARARRATRSAAASPIS